MKRLAIIVSHPIQHFVHFYRALSEQPDLVVKVIYCSRIGIDQYFDTEMRSNIKWAGDLLSGYDYEFLPDGNEIKDVGFFQIDNPSVPEALTRFAPDAVVLYGYAQKAQLRAYWWALRNKVPILMTSDGDANNNRSQIKLFVRKLLLTPFLMPISKFLTVGDQNERMLSRLGVPRSKMVRTPFTIDEASYRSALANRQIHRAAVRAKHGIPAEAFVILVVGKIAPRKRPVDVVNAWKLLPDRERVHVVFCGDGPLRAELETSISQDNAQVSIAGFTNVDALPSYYCAADVLVHPASFDNHPLVCSEAAAVGLPMIVSDQVGAVGATDIARPNENTVVFPCGNVQALADAIARMAGDAELTHRMGQASLRIYDECGMRASVNGLKRALAHPLASLAP